MLSLNGYRFSSGRSKFSDHVSGWPERTAKVFVKVQFGSLDQSLMAQLDTGAAWSILAPDTAIAAQIPLRSEHPAVLHTRFGTKHGYLVRVPLIFIAEEGESLEADGTFFITPDWPDGLNFLGYSGLLDSFRFALDPQVNHFYFG
jgi:hypothetical protein